MRNNSRIFAKNKTNKIINKTICHEIHQILSDIHIMNWKRQKEQSLFYVCILINEFQTYNIIDKDRRGVNGI